MHSAGDVGADVTMIERGDLVIMSYVEPMIAPQARATTLKFVPRGEPGRGG
jgi:hypothetical protein